MKRFILKLQLNNRFDLINHLSDIGFTFGEAYYQHDRVFVPRDYKENHNYPRLTLRTEVRGKNPPVYKLSLRRHIEDSGIDIIEMTPVLDYLASANLIAQLGFTLRSEISRERRALELSKDLRMYLDKVEGLTGEYLKFETDLSPDDKVSAVKKDLEATLATLGQPLSDLISSPYTDLLSLYSKPTS